MRPLFEPVDLAELADDDELIAVRADGAVVIEAVGELGIAAYHVGRLEHRAGDRIVDAAALPGDRGARDVNDLLLRVIHQAHAFLYALADDGAGDDGAVQIEELDPVIVDDPGLLCVGLPDPDDPPAARPAQHEQIVVLGWVD